MADAAEPSALEPTAAGNVSRVVRKGKEIHLLGTAHVSRRSVDEVRRTIAELRPDTVTVELDRTRYEALVDETRFGRVDVRKIIAEGRAGLYLSSLLFAGFQKRIGDKLGVRPGAEMLAGVDAAERAGAQVVFADREVQVTLMRCYRSLAFFDRIQILLVLAMLPFAAGDVDEEEVERLKKRETIGDVMTTFAEQMPSLKVPLIDERDRYLAASIMKAPGERIVAVVGAAHVPGVESRLDDDTDTSALDLIPEPRNRARPLEIVFPVLAAFVAASALFGRPLHHLPASIALRAALPPAVAAMLFVLVAGASVVTAAVAALLAPLTLLFPFLPFDKTLGALECRLRPPAPEHGMRARDDILSPRVARKNRFVRPLLAVILGAFGRAVGAVIGFVWALVHLIF